MLKKLWQLVVRYSRARDYGSPDRRGGVCLDPNLPTPPDVGFYGRDETLLALDRAFDYNNVVLLHGNAGSGKTIIAAEFARWYAMTGGVNGPVLFTSFERDLTLPRVFDRIGQTFGSALERMGVHWLALDFAARRDVALQILSQVPVLWIWDSVEPVTGFPAGTESAWSEKEREELVGFLRAARGTKARFLLTSRRPHFLEPIQGFSATVSTQTTDSQTPPLEHLRRYLQTHLPKLYAQVLEEILADLRKEHTDALAEGRPLKARWVLLRGCGTLTKAAACQLGSSLLGRIATLWWPRGPK